MSIFRLYFMSPHNGHIERFEDFEATDEDAAVELACQREGASPLELWCGGRKIARIEADDPAAKIVARWRERKAVAANKRVAAE